MGNVRSTDHEPTPSGFHATAATHRAKARRFGNHYLWGTDPNEDGHLTTMTYYLALAFRWGKLPFEPNVVTNRQ